MNLKRMIQQMDQEKLQEICDLIDLELERRMDRQQNQRKQIYGYTDWSAGPRGYSSTQWKKRVA